MTVPDLCCVLADQMGGVATVMEHLVRSAEPSLPAGVVLTTARRAPSPAIGHDVGGAYTHRVSHELPRENVYAVLRRLHDAIPHGPGVLLANDWLELAAVLWRPLPRGIALFVHGHYDFYYDLAATYESGVDLFLTHSATIAAALQARLPHRAGDVQAVGMGIPLPSVSAPRTSEGPLRVCFVGRLDAAKGALLVPSIAAHTADCAIAWTIVGDGPVAAEMRAAWEARAPVEWRGQCSPAEVAVILAEHDVLVLPSQAEGMPLVVLEAMVAGCVPLVSDLGPHIAELFDDAGGMRLPQDDVTAWGGALRELAADRPRLAAMQAHTAARARVRFDGRAVWPRVHALLQQWPEWRRPRTGALPLPVGSRLDQPWLPNVVVRTMRAMRGYEP